MITILSFFVTVLAIVVGFLFWTLVKLAIYCGQLQKDNEEKRHLLLQSQAIIDALKSQVGLMAVGMTLQRGIDAHVAEAEHFARKDGFTDA